ncbi:MAG TPA: hypothetical protein IAC41_02295 [Candidatus Merdenecus merdavium]|nr:hypothetical protein [Candidatus Merdenecus merdavium]
MKKKCQRLLVTNIKAKSVVSPSRNDIINLKNIILRRCVGVKARNYKIVDKSTGNEYEFASGTHIQNAEVFAGKEQNTLFTKVFQKNLSKK